MNGVGWLVYGEFGEVLALERSCAALYAALAERVDEDYLVRHGYVGVVRDEDGYQRVEAMIQRAIKRRADAWGYVEDVLDQIAQEVGAETCDEEVLLAEVTRY